MSYFVVLALSLLFSLTVFSQNICIENIKVIDVKNGITTAPFNIQILNQQIFSINNLSCPKGFLKVDGTGKFIMPGLIDMHVHTDLWHYGEKADEFALPLYILNGVTTCRDAAGSRLVLEMKKEIEEGRRFGPNLEVASPFLASNPEASENEIFIETPAAAQEKIIDFKNQGYSSVKVEYDLDSDIYSSAFLVAKENQMYLFGHPLTGKRENGTYFVRLDETLKFHRTLEHLNWTFGDALQDEESPYLNSLNRSDVLWLAFTRLNPSKIPEIVQKVKASGAFVTPTLLVIYLDSIFQDLKAKFTSLGEVGFANDPVLKYLPSYIYQDWKSVYEGWDSIFTQLRMEQMKISLQNAKLLLKAMNDAEIPLLAGTDASARPFAVHGFALHEELKLMASSGVSIPNVIRSTTINAAKALGKSNEIGEVKVGAKADLLILKANPYEGLENLKSLETLILRGKLYDRAQLNKEWEILHHQSQSLITKKQAVNLKVRAQTIEHEKNELH